jgi:ABC-type molybdate transport system permease subunit
MESESASEWEDFEVDEISHLKLKIPPTVICIALLSALSNSQVLSHLGDSFFGLFDLGGAKERSLTYG